MRYTALGNSDLQKEYTILKQSPHLNNFERLNKIL